MYHNRSIKIHSSTTDGKKKQNKVKRSKEENKKQSYNLTYIITASQQFKQK